MTTIIRAAVVALATLIAFPATAQDAKSIVDDAKSRCVIGEVVSGYLAEVKGATAAEKAAMEEINIKRRAVYARLAREQNVAIEVVARLTGEKQIARAKEGECFMDDSGQWKSQ
jgi:uncharacterized protein YdbL (DUF1318 family)